MSQKTCNGLERLKSCWMSICKTWHQFFTFFVSAMFPSFTGSCRPLALELAAAKPAQKASSALKRWSSKKVEQTPANGENSWLLDCRLKNLQLPSGHKRHLQLSKDEARRKLNKLLQMAKQLVAGLTRIIKDLYIFLLMFTLICSQRPKTSTLHIIGMYIVYRNDIIVMKRLGHIHTRCSNGACQQRHRWTKVMPWMSCSLCVTANAPLSQCSCWPKIQ